MIVNQQNLRTLFVGYNINFQKAFEATPTNYQRIATVVPSNTSEQQYAWLGQMPSMREWIGDREIQSLSAYDYTIKNKHFEMTIGVNRDNIEDDTYGVFAPLFANMGECAAQHPDDQVFALLKKGFENLCYDKKPYFSGEHPVGKKKVSNLLEDVLSLESYSKARAMMMTFCGDKGKNLKLIPDLLVVPPQLEAAAKRIIDAEQIDGTSNIYYKSAEILVEPNLSEHPTKWYLLCTKRALKPIIYQERKKIKFVNLTNETDENVFKKNEFLYGADGRNNTGYGFWQMAIGSTGTK